MPVAHGIVTAAEPIELRSVNIIRRIIMYVGLLHPYRVSRTVRVAQPAGNLVSPFRRARNSRMYMVGGTLKLKPRRIEEPPVANAAPNKIVNTRVPFPVWRTDPHERLAAKLLYNLIDILPPCRNIMDKELIASETDNKICRMIKPDISIQNIRLGELLRRRAIPCYSV